jgi:hypothetical protein
MLVGGTAQGRQRAERPDLIDLSDLSGLADLTGLVGEPGVGRPQRRRRPVSIALRLRRRPLDDAQPDLEGTRRRAAHPSGWGATSARPSEGGP